MKSKLFWGITLLLCTLPKNLIAQNPNPTTLSIRGYWPQDSKQKLKVKQSRFKYQNDSLIDQGVIFYDAQMEVLEAKPTGFVLAWTYQNIQAENESDALIQTIAYLSEGLRMVYHTDSLGSFSKLENWEEIQLFMQQTSRRVIQKFGQSPRVMMAYNQARAIFASREHFESTLMRDIQLYHTPYGTRYVLGEEMHLPTQLPNIFGGEPLPAFLRLEIRNYDPVQRTCQLYIRKEMVQNQSRQIVLDFYKALAEQSGTHPPRLGDIPYFQIKDGSLYHIDLNTGWVSRIFFQRTVERDQVRRLDTYEIFFEH